MDSFIDRNMRLRTTTEDGSAGDRGLLTAPLEAQIAKNPPDIIFACGPVGMLKQVIEIANRHGVACQVSIETMMACGMGACLGCAVENRDETKKYWHACLDGPVFNAAEITL
jgi:dihydroorotate dehydrogenase electron transfer subunit